MMDARFLADKNGVFRYKLNTSGGKWGTVKNAITDGFEQLRRRRESWSGLAGGTLQSPGRGRL